MGFGGHGGGVGQFVSAQSGVAYGVIGADLHVFGSGLPLYLLFEFDRAPAAGTAVLPGEAPSRLLDARRQVVEFTGRQEELADLARWRDGVGVRLSARWLHAPGGQGKTRLAMRFAAECAAAGWKVAAAQHGSGSAVDEFGSQDLRLDGAAGLLLVVDYADRWPQPHLAWLLSNALLHHRTPTRILLLARSASTWPAVRAELAKIGAAADTRELRPVPARAGGEDRERIFAVARDCFARRYQVADSARIQLPGRLDDAAFSLTLALHMAALAAVDAHARGAEPPADPVGLRTYLLDREEDHWANLYANGSAGLDYRTAPSVMARAVFTATLAGPTTFRQGSALISALGLEVATDRLLHDHAVCYPPAMPGGATEPLYPDSLGEDFVALSLPGHHVPGYTPKAWAQATAEHVARFVPASPGDGAPHAFARRLITVLSAAADRWPHVIPYLEEILRADPRLAVAAGGAALAALAALDLDPALFEAVEHCLPDHSRTDLDVGAALLAERVAAPRLARIADPVGRMLLYQRLGSRLRNAGRLSEALPLHRRAAGLGELLARTMGAAGAPLGAALTEHGATLAVVGRHQRAVAVTRYAAVVFGELAAAEPEDEEIRAGFGTALHNLAAQYGRAGQPEGAVTVGEHALVLRRQLAARDRPKHEPDLAETLGNLSWQLGGMGQWARAHAACEESIAICRRLAEAEPARYEPVYAAASHNLGLTSLRLGRTAESVEATEDAVAIRRRLADLNPVLYRPLLAGSLANLAICRSVDGRGAEALAAAEESVTALREPAAANPAAYASSLAAALDLVRRLRGDRPPMPAEAVMEEPASSSGGLAAVLDVAEERGIPVIRLTPVDSVWLGPAMAAQQAQGLLAQGRLAEAAEIYAREVTTAREQREAFASDEFDISPQMRRAFDLRLAECLRALGCVQADLEDYSQALSMTAEALEILRRSSPDELEEIQWLIRGLESFALVRAHARDDLNSALDAAAEEAAILQELTGQPFPEHADHVSRARKIGRGIMFLLGLSDGMVTTRLWRNGDFMAFFAREQNLEHGEPDR